MLSKIRFNLKGVIYLPPYSIPPYLHKKNINNDIYKFHKASGTVDGGFHFLRAFGYHRTYIAAY